MFSQVHRDNNSGNVYAHLRQPPVYRVVVVQLLVTLGVSLLLLPFGENEALSALLGGLACSIPNAFFVWKSFQHWGARAALKIARSFYYGEAGKFALTILAFVMIFRLIPSVKPLPLFGAFALIQVVNWFTPLIIKQR